jgi:hypothetical protein
MPLSIGSLSEMVIRSVDFCRTKTCSTMKQVQALWSAIEMDYVLRHYSSSEKCGKAVFPLLNLVEDGMSAVLAECLSDQRQLWS